MGKRFRGQSDLEGRLPWMLFLVGFVFCLDSFSFLVLGAAGCFLDAVSLRVLCGAAVKAAKWTRRALSSSVSAGVVGGAGEGVAGVVASAGGATEAEISCWACSCSF